MIQIIKATNKGHGPKHYLRLCYWNIYNQVPIKTQDTSGYSAYQKGKKVVHDLLKQITSSQDTEQMLHKICNVLIQSKDDGKLKEITLNL